MLYIPRTFRLQAAEEYFRIDNSWDESKHPRDARGRFCNKEGLNPNYKEELRTRQRTLTIKSMYKTKNANNSRSFTDLNPQRNDNVSSIIITPFSINSSE